MPDQKPQHSGFLYRALHSWQAPAALAAIVVIAIVVWALPRRVERVVGVSGTPVWEPEQAPPRREIVWEPAQRIAELSERADEQTQHITPRLTDNGATLYFTQRDQDGHSDIVRSRFLDGEWSRAEPVKGLNTDADEIGPALSADGQTLYFYSDREGGRGGYDIYVATRNKSGWSKPRNLGPQINTPAHEYEPALSPEGLTLYFASNRTKEIEADAADATPSRAWTTTLRARLGKTNFDLYRSSRTDVEADWESAVELAELNLDYSNEGAPFVSPDGAFLYFASDRTARPNELSNLDLYRARWNGERFEPPENLGPSVNTAAHETEPALSPEGFTLVFSSNREGFDRLYRSTAQEVYDETAWDTSHLTGLSHAWWTALLLTLLLAAVAAILLLLRGKLMQGAYASRFVLGSVLLHLLLFLLLAVWSLPTVVEMIVTELQKADPSTQLFDDNQHQSHADGREAYEKVADLRAVEQVAIPDVERLEVAPQSVPERTDQPVPTIPPALARQLPPERVMFVPPEQRVEPVEVQPRQIDAPELVRRPVNRPDAPLELAEAPAELIAEPVEMPAEPDVAVDVQLERRQANVPDVAVLPDNSPLPELTTQPVAGRAEVAAVATEQTPAVAPANTTPTLARVQPTARRQAAEIAESIDLSVVARESQQPAETEIAAANVNVSRQQGQGPSASPNLSEAAPATAGQQPLRLQNPVLARQTANVGRAAEINPAEAPAELQRTKPDQPKPQQLASLQTDAEVELAAAEAPEESQVAAAEADLSKSEPLELTIDVRTPQELTGPTSRLEHRVVIGALAEERNDAPPSLSPAASRLNRRRALGTRVALAEDNVGMKSMFTLRQGDTRKQFIELFGGTDASEQAVNRGLNWLAAHQNEDGSWSLHKFHENCKGHGKCTGAGGTHSNTAATGLALLPFLAAGHTHNNEGPYQQVVTKAVQWMRENQNEDGSLLAKGDQQPMYSHGIAAIALCEAFGMSQDPELKEPAQKSLDFISAAQHEQSGGWRYKPNENGDTSVVGWQMMALKSGEMAGLLVSQKTLDGADRWLKAVEDNQPVGGRFGYTGRGGTPAMTAEGLLCLQFMGVDRNSPRMRAGADYLIKHLPDKSQKLTSYYWYYATQVMYHMQGDYWETWNEAFRDLLVGSQQSGGPMAGTWAPKDQWEKQGGRIYATAIKVLMLEVYYRHLPLYEQLDE